MFAVRNRPRFQVRPVALIPQNGLTLTLPMTAWQEILVLLTTENKRLCQQVDRLTKNSKSVPMEQPCRVPKGKFRGCVNCCKQTGHRCKKQPEIVYCECRPCDKDRAGKIIFIQNPGHNLATSADLSP